MKKFLVALTLTFILVFSVAGGWGVAFAADPAPTAAAPVATPTAAQAAAVTDDLAFPGINLQGDTTYLFKAGTMAPGIGSDIASMYKGLLTLRVEAIAVPATINTPSRNMFGIGPMVNVPKLISRMGGEWQAKVVNPSIGVMPLYDFNNKTYDVGLVVSIIRIDF